MAKRIDYDIVRFLYRAGYRDIDIARRVRCCPSTVWDWRQRNGLVKNSGRVTRMVETPGEFDTRIARRIVLSVTAGGDGMWESVLLALKDIRRHEKSIRK